MYCAPWEQHAFSVLLTLCVFVIVIRHLWSFSSCDLFEVLLNYHNYCYRCCHKSCMAGLSNALHNQETIATAFYRLHHVKPFSSLHSDAYPTFRIFRSLLLEKLSVIVFSPISSIHFGDYRISRCHRVPIVFVFTIHSTFCFFDVVINFTLPAWRVSGSSMPWCAYQLLMKLGSCLRK